jgi:hypothetical protein
MSTTSISNDQLTVRKGITDLLICPLCSNWYREAMTIPECLHTFCKECLYGSFNNHQINQTQKVCPIADCGVVVGKDIYNLKAIYDRNIQAIVDRLCCQVKDGSDSMDRVAIASDATSSSTTDTIAGRKAASARLKDNEDAASLPEDKLMTVLIGPSLPNVHLALVPHPSFIRATLEKSESFPLKKFTLNPNLKLQIKDLKVLIQSEYEKVLTRHQKQYLSSLTIVDTFSSNDDELEFIIDINDADRLSTTVHDDQSNFDILSDEERLLASATMRGFNGDKDEHDNAKVYGKVMRYVLKYHMRVDEGA